MGKRGDGGPQPQKRKSPGTGQFQGLVLLSFSPLPKRPQVAEKGQG